MKSKEKECSEVGLIYEVLPTYNIYDVITVYSFAILLSTYHNSQLITPPSIITTHTLIITITASSSSSPSPLGSFHNIPVLLPLRSMADKIKEVAVEEADRIKSLASDAARSGAYLYPIRVSTRTPPSVIIMISS